MMQALRALAAWMAPAMALAGWSAPAAAAELVLAPVPGSSWIVNYGETSCRLLRDFGSGEQRTMLIVEQFEPGAGFTLILAGAPLAEYARDRQVFLSFGAPEGDVGERQIHWQRSNFGALDPAMTLYSMQLQRETQERSDGDDVDLAAVTPMAIGAELTSLIDRVELRSGGDRLRLSVPRMGEALQTLNQCSQGRLTGWGLDKDVQLSLTRRAMPNNLQDVARAIQRKYPPQAIARGEHNGFFLRMMVDETGAASDCTLTGITEVQDLVSPACAQFARLARFEPALDAGGQPVKSYYTTKILYSTR